jgi:DNA polymerase-3 subunit epsilon
LAVVFYKLHYKFRRWRFHEKAVATPLQPLYEQPGIQASQLFSATRFLVIDCEMSGLNVKKSQLLSIGWVMIENGRIVNASAKHFLIHADQGAGESSKIHGLLDSNLAGASSVATVLMLLMKQMPGAVLVFHHASLDMRFLQKAAIENFRCPLLFSYADTMAIEKRRLHLHGKAMSLRLPQCRDRYGLPAGSQHDALADAQATAELFLAQASYLGKQESLRLSELSLSCSP